MRNGWNFGKSGKWRELTSKQQMWELIIWFIKRTHWAYRGPRSNFTSRPGPIFPKRILLNIINREFPSDLLRGTPKITEKEGRRRRRRRRHKSHSCSPLAARRSPIHTALPSLSSPSATATFLLFFSLRLCSCRFVNYRCCSFLRWKWHFVSR